jgi:hypothetical protein
MGFDDLDEAMSEQDAEETSTTEASEGDRQDSAPEPTANLGQSTDSTRDATEDDSATSSLDHPAFPFEDSKQEAIYPTVETLTEFDDTLDFEVKRRLRDEGLRDVPKREYHEALLQLAIEQPERLAELIIENRR